MGLIIEAEGRRNNSSMKETKRRNQRRRRRRGGQGQGEEVGEEDRLRGEKEEIDGAGY